LTGQTDNLFLQAIIAQRNNVFQGYTERTTRRHSELQVEFRKQKDEEDSWSKYIECGLQKITSLYD
jgi:hypothetical protein